MLKDIARPVHKTQVFYELVFDDGENNGYGFPCDKDGNLDPGMSKTALETLAYAKAHPEDFVRYNEVVRFERNHTELGYGTCSCGSKVVLQDVYYGACQCGNCGRWYNLFGQELLSPEYWEEDPSEEGDYYGDGLN